MRGGRSTSLISGALAAVLVAAMAACGDDGSDAGGTAETTAAPTTAPATVPPTGPTTPVSATSPPAQPWPGGADNEQPEQLDPTTANLSLIKQKLEQYHDSGEYERDLEAMATRAEECMLDALPGATKPALVLDIDETALSNYAWMVSVDFLRTSPLLSDLFATHAQTEAIPAIQPVLDLYESARDNGIEVFFISGRGEHLREATETNLRNVGYTDFTQAYLTSPDYHEQSIIPFKSESRADIEAQGYTIIANVGDQNSDLEGGHGGCPHKLVDPYYYIP